MFGNRKPIHLEHSTGIRSIQCMTLGLKTTFTDLLRGMKLNACAKSAFLKLSPFHSRADMLRGLLRTEAYV